MKKHTRWSYQCREKLFRNVLGPSALSAECRTKIEY